MPYADALLVWRELEEHPPVRMLFARFVGYKNPNRRFKAAEATADDFVAIQKVLGPVAPMPAEMKEALRWAEGMKKKHPGLVQ
jgi:hypothetical protein